MTHELVTGFFTRKRWVELVTGSEPGSSEWKRTIRRRGTYIKWTWWAFLCCSKQLHWQSECPPVGQEMVTTRQFQCPVLHVLFSFLFLRGSEGKHNLKPVSFFVLSSVLFFILLQWNALYTLLITGNISLTDPRGTPGILPPPRVWEILDPPVNLKDFNYVNHIKDQEGAMQSKIDCFFSG